MVHNRTACSAYLPGDFPFEACGAVHHVAASSFCRPDRSEKVCNFCKCKTCDFCRPDSPVAASPVAASPVAASTATASTAAASTAAASTAAASSASVFARDHHASHWAAQLCAGRSNAREAGQYCLDFTAPNICIKFYVPKGTCEWRSRSSDNLSEASCVAVSVPGGVNLTQICFAQARNIHRSPLPPRSRMMSPPPPLAASPHPRSLAPPLLPLAARLNQRFASGVPSNSLEHAGVLVHILDRTEDSTHAWLPCREGWCVGKGFSGRLSASLINAGQPGFWRGGVGLVFAPEHTSILCSYGEDGGSMKFSNGCNPSPCSTSYPWKCSWHAHHLKEMMEYQRVRKGGGGYNEVIVSAHNWTLPAIIEGIFETDEGAAKGLHADFLATYGLTAAAFPRIRLDRDASAKAPFREATT